MERLPRVLFQMDAEDSDRVRSVIRLIVEDTVRGDGVFVLGDLISLRQVGIEIVLPRKNRARLDGAPQRQSDSHRQFDDLTIQHRERSRKPETHGAHVRVRGRPERGGTPAEDFRLGS